MINNLNNTQSINESIIENTNIDTESEEKQIKVSKTKKISKHKEIDIELTEEKQIKQVSKIKKNKIRKQIND